MAHDGPFRTATSYNSGMLKTLHRLLDTFSFTAAIAVLLAFIRVEQFGPAYISMIVMLLLFCVAPSFFMRADRQIPVRGIIVISGFLAALAVGISSLGCRLPFPTALSPISPWC